MKILLENMVTDLLPMASVVVADIVGVIVAVMIDFVSGIAKARREGVARTSRGFRRTVTKLCNYLLLLFAMMVTDGIIVLTMELSRMAGGWSIIMMPWLTSMAAIGITLIEVKSVLENSGNSHLADELEKMATRVVHLKKMIDR